MSIKKITAVVLLLSANCAMATDSPINGTVQPKCSVYTETQGVFGNPLPNKLERQLERWVGPTANLPKRWDDGAKAKPTKKRIRKAHTQLDLEGNYNT